MPEKSITNNQELVSFPFRPHLAKYLFYLCKNEIIETEEAHYRHLDINLKSPDGVFLRSLCQRKNIPGLSNPSRGFRFTIRIPKHSKEFNSYIEDSRTKAIWIDEKTATIIQDHFESRFRDHFISFVSGSVFSGKRSSLKNAILFFMDQYDLHADDVEYNYDQLVKLYERNKSPLKTKIYNKQEQTLKPSS